MARFTASFAIFLLCLSISCGEDSKRILVNDPTYFETRHQHLETLIQNQAATIAKQQAEINVLKQQNATTNKIVGDIERNLKAEILGLRQKVEVKYGTMIYLPFLQAVTKYRDIFASANSSGLGKFSFSYIFPISNFHQGNTLWF